MHRPYRPTNITRRRFLQGSAAFGGAAFLGACAPTTTPAASTGATPAVISSGGTLRVGYSQPTTHSHFFHLHNFASGELIYSKQFPNAKLLTLNSDLTNFVPALAEDWAFSNEGTTLTFKLREGLTWHDGEPFTAADVDFTWHQMSTPGMSPRNRGQDWVNILVGMREWIDGDADRIEGIRVVDDTTIAFDFPSRINSFLLLTAFNGVWMAPRHILSDYLDRDAAPNIMSSEWATTAAHVGIGPFRVVEYEPDEVIVFEPFDNYYKGRPNLDRLIYVPYLSDDAFVAAFSNQELDLAVRFDIPEEVQRVAELDWLHLWEGDALACWQLTVNTQQPHLADPRIRKALMYAMDRETVINNVIQYGAYRRDTIIGGLATGQWGNSPDLYAYDYNPDEARRLLDEAGGWEAGRTLRWDIGTLRPEQEPWWVAFFSYWADNLGIETEFVVHGTDRSAFRAEGGWDYDLGAVSTPVGHPTVALSAHDMRRCEEWCSRYGDARWEELIDQSALELGEDENRAAMWELQEIMTDQVLSIPLFGRNEITAVKNTVQDLELSALNAMADWGMENVRVT